MRRILLISNTILNNTGIVCQQKFSHFHETKTLLYRSGRTKPPTTRGLKKLGWQNQLEEVRLQRRARGDGRTANASTQGAVRTARLPCLPQLLPGPDGLRSPCGGGRPHPACTVQAQTRGSPCTPCGATVVRAIRPEQRLEIMSGPGQLRPRLAGQASGPVTAGDLPAVRQRGCTGARRRLGSCPRAPPGPEAALPRPRLRLGWVAEEVGGLRDPAIPSLDLGPYRSRVPQAPRQQARQPRSCLGQGPLCATRSRRAVMAGRRAGRVSPEAARGGRPAAVRARRTAPQAPRPPAASGALRPARRRALGRPPRTRFVRACVAWRTASAMGVAAARREGKGHHGWGTAGNTAAPAPRLARWPAAMRPTMGTGMV